MGSLNYVKGGFIPSSNTVTRVMEATGVWKVNMLPPHRVEAAGLKRSSPRSGHRLSPLMFVYYLLVLLPPLVVVLDGLLCLLISYPKPVSWNSITDFILSNS